MAALGDGVTLARDPGIITAQTSVGAVPTVSLPVSMSSDVNIVVLSDTLNAADLSHLRKDFTLAFSQPFLAAHSVHFLYLTGGNIYLNEPLPGPAALPSLLKRLVPGTNSGGSLTELLTQLADSAPAFGKDWSRVIIAGRFPSLTPEEQQSAAWLSAWIGDRYRSQRLRTSFWALDAIIPSWAQELSQSSLGASAETLAPLLSELNINEPVYQVSWGASLKAGGWPSLVTLVNKAGDRVAKLTSLCAVPGFSPPLAGYLAARAAMAKASPDNESAADSVLDINPADVEALTDLGKLYRQQHKAKEAAAVWHRLSDINPADGAVWAELGFSAYHTESFDEAESAFKRASELGVTNRSTLQTRCLLSIRHNDYADALLRVEEALALASETGSNDQSLLLLRADCAHGLKRWPMEAESLERAMTLGPVPLERTTNLIDGYLSNGQADRAVAYLRASTHDLPKDASIQCRYATFWEKVHDDTTAETLWENATAADQHFEGAYLGLAANQLRTHRNSEALRVIDRGLSQLPQSYPLLLAKERALESGGDLYAARRLLSEHAADAKSSEMLERRSQVEDWYGSAGAEAYSALLKLLAASGAPSQRISETARRGFTVALRDEKPELARSFAAKLAEGGDQSGLALLKVRDRGAVQKTELPGGLEAFNFLLFGGGKARPERVFKDACRSFLSSADEGAAASGKNAWQLTGQRVHEYFQRVAALVALGERKGGKVEIQLTLSDKAGKQRTEKVFSILGLKLKHGKEGTTLQAALGKEQTKKQDTLSALAINDQDIQDALSSGKTYVLEVLMDTVPVFPSEDLWRQAFNGREKYAGGMAELLVSDVRIPRLYLALNSMDRGAAEALLKSVPLRTLAERYSEPLALFSSALAIRGGHAEVPGGRTAEGVWLSLAGDSPANAAGFFQTLLNKDDGRLMAFFYTLSQLDSSHQSFFTRSAERTKRFYSLFRESPEMRRGGDIKLGNSSFIDFLRNIPLNDDGSVDFPGSPEVWMVVKGRSASEASVGKIARKMKKVAAPDDEDQILSRLATTDYKAQDRQTSELANFIAVTQIDEQRDDPLSVESALLLAQGYGEYRGLFPYFAELGDLEPSDYQAAFSFQQKVSGLNAALANVRLGEFHCVLAMLGLIRESGLVPGKKVPTVYRACIQRFLAATDSAAWTLASLSAMDDLSQIASPASKSRDKAIRTLLIGADASARRAKSFEQVLALQKVPSLDGLSSIRTALKTPDDPHALDEIQRQLAALAVIPLPKTWKFAGERKKYFDYFETAQAQGALAKLRERLSKKKRNPADAEKLAAQMMAELEPWTQLAMAGRIYARFLDGSDMLVSEDTMLLRKHEFISLETRAGRVEYFPAATLFVSSEGGGSRFEGGLATFSMAAGEARVAGNHIGAAANPVFSKAVIASIVATDWRALTPAGLISFNATVRLAREWIVASATSEQMLSALEIQTRGILSINRRNTLLEALDRRDWPTVWRSVSISDLHFLGDGLLEHAPDELWNSAALTAMKVAAAHTRELDLLGPVAPDLSGCGQPRLRRYEPYEEYQRHFFPERLAERLSELKLYLAWMSDAAAWSPEMLPEVSLLAADHFLNKVQMHDIWDWEAALEAFRELKPEEVEGLATRQ